MKQTRPQQGYLKVQVGVSSLSTPLVTQTAPPNSSLPHGPTVCLLLDLLKFATVCDNFQPISQQNCVFLVPQFLSWVPSRPCRERCRLLFRAMHYGVPINCGPGLVASPPWRRLAFTRVASRSAFRLSVYSTAADRQTVKL
ncbi:hypothetical protein J6590_015621 [Homalodisca vitripennis]|nr:hypothetical protein J6590_015621 [Homalodisca vitripennis]